MTDHPDHASPNCAALLDIVLQLRADYGAHCTRNVALRDKIHRLKGLPSHPPMKPSGMEASSKPPSPPVKASKRRGLSQAVVTEERCLGFEQPVGSRFVGRRNFVVQDLRIAVRVIRHERDRWQQPPFASGQGIHRACS
jgi:hypothetical protein